MTVDLLDTAALELARQEQLVEQFVSRCGCDGEVARVQLGRHVWEL